MAAKRKGEIVPGYEKVNIFGHLLTIDGRQVYHHAGRGEYSIERDFRHLVGLNARERIIVEHALAWAKEDDK